MAVRSIGVLPHKYGAVGDGVIDDTTAFNDLFANESHILIPPGKYRLTGSVLMHGYGRRVAVHAARNAVLSFEGLGAGAPCVELSPAANGKISPDSTTANAARYSTWWGGKILRNNTNGPLFRVFTSWFAYVVDVELQGGDGYFDLRGGEGSSGSFQDWAAESGPIACYGHGGDPDWGIQFGCPPFAGGSSPHSGETNRPSAFFCRMIGSAKAGCHGMRLANGGTNIDLMGSYVNFGHAHFHDAHNRKGVVWGIRTTGQSQFIDGRKTDPVDGTSTLVDITTIGRNAQGDVTKGQFKFFGADGVTEANL